MAYTSASLGMVSQTAGPLGMKTWVYDTVDTNSTVYAINYISDALTRGMQKGDIVYVRIWTTAVPTTSAEMVTTAATANILTATYIHLVLGISTAGAADLTNGLAITITNS
jgi:hypothetical protein